MAENKNKEKGVTPVTPTPKKEEKKPAKKTKKDKIREMSPEEREKYYAKRAARTSWILVLVSITLFVCMVLDLITLVPAIFGVDGVTIDDLLANAEKTAPLLGSAGYFIFKVLYGIFGYSFLLVPILMFILGLLWKSLVKQKEKVGALISGAIFLLFFDAFFHVLIAYMLGGMSGGVHINSGEQINFDIVNFFKGGHILRTGGVIGGSLGYAFFSLLDYAGTFILSIVAMLVSGIIFLHLDPSVWVDKIREAIKAKHQKRKAEKQKEKEISKEQKRIEKEAAAAEKARLKEIQAEEKKKAAEERKNRELAAPANPEKSQKSESESKAQPNPADEWEEPEGFDKVETKKPEKAESFNDDEEAERVFPKTDNTKEKTIEVEGADDDFTNIFDTEKANQRNKNVKDNGVKDLVNGMFETETYGIADETDEEEEEGEEGEEGEEEEKTSDPVVADVPEYVFPPLDLLKQGSAEYGAGQNEIDNYIAILKETFENFKIKVRDITCTCGPTVTRYEIKPEAGVRVRAIANLQDDIALNLAKSGVRIEAPIPGKPAVGIEVPNEKPSTVNFRNVIDTPEFFGHKSKIAAGLGVDISGKPLFCDIEKMPHMLIAGTTGSGKSVCINSIIMSILYHASPEDVRLVLIDPKKVEFKVYKDIPHLCTAIVTDPKRAAGALNSAVNEMEHRFELIEDVGVRDIKAYNELTKNDPERKHLPRIVIIIDELADLMMTARDEVETAICRIAQKARAAGIHLIIGTQRPSVDVITGLIKANVPSRIAFTVKSQVDSRTILDISGAEKLCGRGDMLYSPVGSPKPMRVQGAYVDDNEVEDVVSFVKSHNAPVVFDEGFTRKIDEEVAKYSSSGSESSASSGDSGEVSADGEDPKFWEAVHITIESGRASTSLLQRKLEVGYGRAAKLIDRMEEKGFVGSANGTKPREVLVTEESLRQLQMNQDEGQE